MQPTSEHGVDGADATAHRAGERVSRDRLAIALGGAVAVIALVVLIVGWGLGVEVVTRVLPGLESMKVNTALALLALGAAPLIASRRPRWLAGVMVSVLILGVLTWMQYAFGLDFGIDQALTADLAVGGAPGRPGVITAACFSMLACGWLLARPAAGDRTHALGRASGMTAGVLAAFAMFGYMFGVTSSSGVGSATEMALHTSIAVVIAAAAFVVDTSDRGPLAVLWSPHVGGQMGRALLLPGVAAVLVCVFVSEALVAINVLGSQELELAFLTMLAVVVIGALVTVAANRLESTGLKEIAARRDAAAARDRLAVANDELEQRVVERTAALALAVEDLQRTNRDLEQFTFAASHDLKEPLRMVSMYTRLLSERYVDELGERGRVYASYAVEGADRMRELIDGILRYSGAASEDLRAVPIDLAQVVHAVAAELGADDGAVTVAPPLPDLIGDPRVVREVVTIVIHNALKFVADGVDPRVEVSGMLDPTGQSVVHVADNGIGITEPDRVGDMFMRLNHRTRYPGSGVGLAVAQRLLRRHGGSLAAKARPGGGTVMEIRIGEVVRSADHL